MPTLADLFPGYQPPQKCLGRCRHCGVMVLGRVFDMQAQRYTDCEPRQEPVTGQPHRCVETLKAADADTPAALTAQLPDGEANHQRGV